MSSQTHYLHAKPPMGLTFFPPVVPCPASRVDLLANQAQHAQGLRHKYIAPNRDTVTPNQQKYELNDRTASLAPTDLMQQHDIDPDHSHQKQQCPHLQAARAAG